MVPGRKEPRRPLRVHESFDFSIELGSRLRRDEPTRMSGTFGLSAGEMRQAINERASTASGAR